MSKPVMDLSKRECPTCRGAETITRMVAPGDFRDDDCPDCIEFWRERSDGWERYAKELEEQIAREAE